VVFVNEQSGEYQYYEIQFRALRPGVISTIKLSTTVRQRKQHTLTLDNPLATSVTFSATCNLTDLQIPGQISVPTQSTVSYVAALLSQSDLYVVVLHITPTSKNVATPCADMYAAIRLVMCMHP